MREAPALFVAWFGKTDRPLGTPVHACFTGNVVGISLNFCFGKASTHLLVGSGKWPGGKNLLYTLSRALEAAELVPAAPAPGVRRDLQGLRTVLSITRVGLRLP